MLISCPNCKTTFAVPAKMIANTGRKVKCAKCAHIWFQEPIKIELDNVLKVEYKPSTNLPVRFKKQKFKLSYVFMLVVFLVVAATIEVMKRPDDFPAFAAQLDADNYDGLRFHSFKVESEIVDNKLDYYLSGSIVNVTNKKMRIPIIDVKVFSKGGRIMAENQLAIPKEFIEPFQRVDVNPEITGISGNADKIEISFENWLEATFR